MRKIKPNKIWILLFLILLIPFNVSAKSADYDVKKLYIDAKVLENGDMEVKELIVLDGYFNSYVRDLMYQNSKLKPYNVGDIDFSNSSIYNAKGISNVKLYAKKASDVNEIDFETFDEVFVELKQVLDDKTAKTGDYYLKYISNGRSYKMYYPAEDEAIVFYISYRIDSAVVMHEDIAELYWTFIGNGFDDIIEELKIQVSLPENSETLQFWMHGDITGNIERVNENTVMTTINKVSKNSPIDVRMIFEKEQIKDATNLRFSEDRALEKILEIENKRAERRNREIEMIRAVYVSVKNASVIYCGFLAVLWMYMFFKYDKEYRSTFKEEYFKDFIEDYNVEIVDYLMNKKITTNALSASVVNLIYKKNIKVEEIKKKNHIDYRFTLLNRKNTSDTEDMLIDLLFDTVGDRKTFNNSEMQKFATNEKTCHKFARGYDSWQSCARKEGERERFFESNGVPIVSAILMFIVSFLIFMIGNYYSVDFFLIYCTIPAAICFLIYTLTMNKKTKRGRDHYIKWKAFKKFLENFGSFKEKELPEIELWERYLVYATVFDLTEKVQVAMNVKLTYMEINAKKMKTLFDTDFYLYHVINQNIQMIMKENANATNTKSSESSLDS